jgi:dTDP-4-dehydrorhamnose 3,5-epimerase
MNVFDTDLPGVKRVEPRVFGDERGWFLETWREERYREHGIGPAFVQANCSRSTRGVLRGLHYQWPEPQGKLVWVSEGRVFDVAVDIRPGSSRFGHWTGVELDAATQGQLWIPEGFAHGFQVLSESATFHYLCTRPYRGEFDA